MIIVITSIIDIYISVLTVSVATIIVVFVIAISVVIGVIVAVIVAVFKPVVRIIDVASEGIMIILLYISRLEK